MKQDLLVYQTLGQFLAISDFADDMQKWNITEHEIVVRLQAIAKGYEQAKAALLEVAS